MGVVAGALGILADWWARLLAVRAPGWVRPLLVMAVSSGLAFVHALQPGKSSDFTVFWAAAHHAFGPVYDVNFITAAQAGLAQGGPRPFEYPPTFLLLILPLAMLPYRLAYVLWVGASSVAFVECAGRMTRWPWLVMLSPVFMFTALIGQTTLLVGALLVLALSPRMSGVWAGAALGLALAMKPQSASLAPVVLCLRLGWRPAAIAAAVAGLLVLSSLAAFGAGAWEAWLGGLRGFVGVNDSLHIARLGAPSLPGKVAAGVTALGLMVWSVRAGDELAASASAIGGALLISPHAPFYEVTMLLPAAVAWLWRPTWRIVPALAMLAGWIETPLMLAAWLATAAPWGAPARRPRHARSPAP
ncbi:glycosyltransferase 87 family protein [Caulobacter sp. KR2-114]|uniref:glycosyltransferase 87 family protein n=1 Tax=Caulobacter sp. KR2-114 TaxID=3400912 RepID=UPI003C0E16EC